MRAVITCLWILLAYVSAAFFAGDTWAAKAETDKAKESPFSNMEYRLAGPTIGGRVTRVSGVIGDPLTFYAAFAQGGVWKSSDGGHAWQPIFDEQPTQSIGSIAVAPSDPNVIYVGGGEANIRGNVAPGMGIFKSTDAGKTWQHVWKQFGQIGTLEVHPKNPDIAYAAVLGHAFGDNPERGIYRTQDGGKSWQQVLKRDAKTGASDLAIDPNNPRRVFAGLWQTKRTPWDLSSGGDGSGLFFSADNGEQWKELGEDEGLPKKPWGKVGVRVAPSDSRRVYALIEANDGGLFRSNDGGESFARINDHNVLRQRAWYYSHITVDPHNADIVWVPQVRLLRSIDGGKSFQRVSGPSHGDHHDLWIDPSNSKRMINGHDGGIDLSVDGAENWWNPKLPVAQFYNIDADNRVPYHIGGTIQDMGTASGPSSSLFFSGTALAHWQNVGGGEAGDFVYDRKETGVVYAGEYSGYISHYDEKTNLLRNISPYPFNNSGHGADRLKYRIQWTAPIFQSPHDNRTLYYGANVLFKTGNRGESWEIISGDLTRDDKSKQLWSGGPITGDNTGVEIYNTIFSIAESPITANELWVGSDDGLVHISQDGGKNWSNITPRDMPEWGTVESIEPSRFAAGTAYMVVDAHRMDDYRPHVFVTRNHGKSWQRIQNGLPADMHFFVLREDSKKAGLLFAGGDRGIFISHDDGKLWQSLQLNLPAVPVADLLIKNDDLVLGTRGRSIWILDNINPLRDWNESLAQKSIHVFATQATTLWERGDHWNDATVTDNAEFGARIAYFLKDKVEGELRLEILDAQGKLIRTLSSIAKPVYNSKDDPDEPQDEPEPELETAAGLHFAVWDLHHEGAKRLPNAKVDIGNPENGPRALPGSYTARFKAGDKITETAIQLIADPRSPLAVNALKASQDFALSVRDAISQVADQVIEIRAIRDQVKDIQARISSDEKHKSLQESVAIIIKQCDGIEERLHNPNAKVVYDILAQRGGAQLHSQLAMLYEFSRSSGHAPTKGMLDLFAEYSVELKALSEQSTSLKQGELQRLEAEAARLKLPQVILPNG